MSIRLAIVLVALLAMQACNSSDRVQREPAPVTANESSYDADDPRFDQLIESMRRYDADPTDEDNIIWLGRRLAYLERFDAAIDVYTRGLKIHPESYRLLRHRGHRYISTRHFEKAIADLNRAAALIHGKPIEIEPDGMPNAAGVPRSNTQFNIYYHLGLAHYLRYAHHSAYGSYMECLKYCDNDDLTCATTHWLYMTLRRIGWDQDAAFLIQRFPDEPDIIENDGYHALIQLYRGERTFDELLDAVDLDNMTVEDVTIAFGLVQWLMGEAEAALKESEMLTWVSQAVDLRDAILRSPHKYAFGYIAAEVQARAATRERSAR